MKKYLPILHWLPYYTKLDFRKDLFAGITVAILLVPQGMAYALIAGLPPVYGLYASIVPLFLYALFGTSRQLSVGPVALVSLLILAGLGEFAKVESELYIQLAIFTALMAGVIQLALGFFKLGFLINFLSHPVISGFTSAAAIMIGVSQLSNLVGIEVERSNQIIDVFAQLLSNIKDIHSPTLLLGVGSFLMLLLIRRIKRSLPAALLVLVVSIPIVWYFDLANGGVAIVGSIPEGLPYFSIPKLSFEQIKDLIPLSLTICLISFIESLAIAKSIESRHKSYRVEPNQELIALGISKIGGAFFQSFPTTGSFSRSAVNDEAGARSGISSIICALLIALILMFFTSLFFYLPKAVLAAIIMASVINLIDYKEAVYLRKTDRSDFSILVTTFIITLLVGIQQGVLAGVVLSLVMILYESSRPYIAILGQLKSGRFRNIQRFPNATQWEDVLIIRFDEKLYFGNADFFRQSLEDMVEQKGEKLKLVILHAAALNDIDSTGVHTLVDMIDYLKNREVKFFITAARGPLRDKFYRTGIMNFMEEKAHFLTIRAALHNFREEEDQQWSEDAVQTRYRKKTKKK